MNACHRRVGIVALPVITAACVGCGSSTGGAGNEIWLITAVVLVAVSLLLVGLLALQDRRNRHIDDEFASSGRTRSRRVRAEPPPQQRTAGTSTPLPPPSYGTDLGEHLNRLERRIMQVEETVDMLRRDYRTMPRPLIVGEAPQPLQERRHGYDDPIAVDPITVRLYAETPDGDAYFGDERLTGDRRDLSLYEIQPAPTGRTASVTLCDGSQAQQVALEQHKRLLMPVCDYQDNELPRREHTQVIVTKKGTAERADGGWQVTTKVTVRFS
jgi:hypothetical protein